MFISSTFNIEGLRHTAERRLRIYSIECSMADDRTSERSERVCHLPYCTRLSKSWPSSSVGWRNHFLPRYIYLKLTKMKLQQFRIQCLELRSYPMLLRKADDFRMCPTADNIVPQFWFYYGKNWAQTFFSIADMIQLINFLRSKFMKIQNMIDFLLFMRLFRYSPTWFRPKSTWPSLPNPAHWGSVWVFCKMMGLVCCYLGF